MEKCSKDSILIKSRRMMTRIVVVSSTYPDLKSCQRNLVNWVASMRKGVAGEFDKRLRAGLFQNELQTSYSWNIFFNIISTGRISFWQHCSSSPFHHSKVSLLLLEIRWPHGGPEHFRSCVCQGISEDSWWLLTIADSRGWLNSVEVSWAIRSHACSLLSTCAY